MNSRSPHNIWPLRRHDLITAETSCWNSIIDANRCLHSEPLISEWKANGWPVVVRRPIPGEPKGLPVGLPLPPSAGKKRLSFVIQQYQIRSFTPPPFLSSVQEKAPSRWLATIRAVHHLASHYSLDAREFGSLGWSLVTGLDYLTSSSDLDLLFYIRADTDLDTFTNALARIEAAAPMRLDGELVRENGVAVNWKESQDATNDILIKSINEPRLIDRKSFSTRGARL